MKLSDFDYPLPDERIAQEPLSSRDASKLLVLGRESGIVEHRFFHDFPDLLRPNDLLVLNRTKVLPVRLLGTRDTGGKVECFVLEALGRTQAHCLVRSSAEKKGLRFRLESGEGATVLGPSARDPGQFLVEFDLEANDSVRDLMLRSGHMPLPPYIRRPDADSDSVRYQTVFAEKEGSVAAPTAGLHFTNEILDRIKAKGVEIAKVTLHVGLGTFLPIKTENIDQHKMHGEWFEVSEPAAKAIAKAKSEGRRIVAVGTTSVRTLESYARMAKMGEPFSGETKLFLQPGESFLLVGGIFTNFHQPKSTLLVLMSAFAGRERIFGAYSAALREQYRFLSYGDGMFVS